MTTNYARGVYAERLALAELRAAGYIAVRTAGSHGSVDVIAWNSEEVRFIQVKRKKGGVKADVRQLYRALFPCSGTPLVSVELWYYKPGSTTPEKVRCL